MTDEWETPQELFDDLNEEFNFTLDPCCTKETAKCHKYYTIEDDGLSIPWSGERVFMNPPYSNITPWMKKAYESYDLVVALVPAWTDRIWYHDYVYKKECDIRFLKGRVRFLLNGEVKTAPRFGSMLVIYND